MTNVLEYLENSARLVPDRVAAEDENSRCTYAELRDTAERIGSSLARETAPRRPVVVLMQKSVRALEALMGVVYAGCFYVYISPDQVTERVRQILSVTEAGCVLTDQPCLPDGFGFTGKVLRCGDLAAVDPDPAALRRIREQALDIDPLYCNFTSGSTGVPKGVLVCHRSVIDFIGCFPDLFGITGADVLGNQAPFDFDVSVKDIYTAFRTGAKLVLIPRRLFSVVTELLDYLNEKEVTTLIWAVSALCLVVQFRGLTYRIPERVNKVLFSGEVMPAKILQQWRDALPRAEFVNLYGPTEITCNCTWYRLPDSAVPGGTVPIGHPFPNEKVFLLDENDRAVTAPGVCGEICVSGTAVALGYYRCPAQTAAVFVQNPLNAEYPERICRTGDLAYYDQTGELCFAGRRDFQIKYMGHRIELEEIESALNRQPRVERACCAFDRRKNRIVAVYCGTAQPAELKKALFGILPRYMIPSVFHCVDSLPLNANGKIDRKRLDEAGETA